MNIGSGRFSFGHLRSQRHPSEGIGSVVILIGLAGAAGALARYGMATLLGGGAGSFPWGTFAVNVTGSLLIGLVLAILVARPRTSPYARPLIVTGFIGAYTTFSTYMVDTDLLFRAHDLAIGVAYLLSSVACGLVATFAGIAIGRAGYRLIRRAG